MERLGILTGADLCAQPLGILRAHFGSIAEYLYGAARGHDERPVRPDRPLKSVGAERTFDRDLTDVADLTDARGRVAEVAWSRIERSSARGRTTTLKVRFADFQTITRARSQPGAFADRATFELAGA